MSDPAFPSLELAVTVNGLGDHPRAAFNALSARGFRHVQLDAAAAGMRPRDLDRSARRDLAASLRRRELDVSGLDLWIPPAHYVDPGRADRAVSAVMAAVEMAADLDHCPVSVTLPAGDGRGEIAEALAAHAGRRGVPVADHAVPPADDVHVGVGIDPAAWLANAEDPCDAVARWAASIAAARLCDLTADGLRAPAGDRVAARLDVTAYRVALSVAGHARPVVIDTRQWREPWAGVEQTRAVWEAVAEGAEGLRG